MERRSLAEAARVWALASLCLLFIPCPVHAAVPSAPEKPDDERRSLLIMTNGSVAPPAARSAPAPRQEAAKKARAELRERAAEYLTRSGIRAAGLSFALGLPGEKDPVRVLGRQDANKPDHPPRLRLEAEIPYLLRGPAAQGMEMRFARTERTGLLTVRLWTDRRRYRKGEPIAVYLQANRDGHVRLLRVGVRGEIRQLLPNNYRQASFLAKGKVFRIPGEGDRFDLRAGEPFGKERFFLCAATAPMSHVNMKTVAGGVYEYRSSLRSFHRAVRSGLASPDGPVVEFYEAAWDIETEGR